MFNSITNELFNRTENNGMLYLESWYHEDDEMHGRNIYRCKMNWTAKDVSALEEQLQKNLTAIRELGELYREHEDDFEFGTDPKEVVSDEGIYEDLHFDGVTDVWNKYFKDFKNDAGDVESLIRDCEERTGYKTVPYFEVIFARRICKLYSLGTPKIIILNEERYYSEAYIINHFAESVEEIPFLGSAEPGSFIRQTFDITKDDTDAISKMVIEYPYLLQEKNAGYFRLCYHVFHDPKCYMAAICRFDKLKAEIDLIIKRSNMFDQEIARAIYGLDDGIRSTYNELSCKYYLSESQIALCEANVIRKLNSPMNNRGLKKLIESVTPERFEAFIMDKRLAEYRQRIEDGNITEEEEKSRNQLLDFLGFPDRKTHFYDGTDDTE